MASSVTLGNPPYSDDFAGADRRNPTTNTRTSNGRSGAGPRSSMPPPPTSESGGGGGALSDVEGGGFAGDDDDEVVGARGTDRSRPRDPMARAVPKVVDRVGEKVAEEFEGFLEQFVEDITLSAGGAPPPSSAAAAMTSDKYYIAQIHGLRIYNLSTLYVDFFHLLSLPNQQTLANAIANDYYRYLPFLIRALHNLIAKHEPRYFREHRQPASSTSQTVTAGPSSSASVAAAAQSSQGGGGASGSENLGTRTTNQQTDKLFTLAFYNLPLTSRVRSLRTSSIGKLLSISGTVTRTSEVRPELYLATFTCEGCRTIIRNIEQTFRYTEPTQCPNLTCGNRQGWRLDIRQSTFVDWQKVRIQENAAEIPTGSMPRTMDVILRGEIVERAKAGEKCVFTGTLIVVPDVSQMGVPGVKVEAMRDNRNTPRNGDAAGAGGGSGVTGLKALGVRDLTYRMAFLACMVTPDTSTSNGTGGGQQQQQSGNILTNLLNQNAAGGIDPLDSSDHAQDAYLQSLSAAEIEDLKHMVHSDHVYSRLVNSLAPMVYGHEIVKKGLLLQLMGGVSKVTPEGMQLRGDINICVVGDPSTSKSQFLKYITSLTPRSVYTSGKASSAAGLTAAVVKDEETGEFTIEAGALMLADNGICAIDEFDKMDLADQVAIHEAMEQQTISIAKAGIQATLNARTSILAAANPVGGRYNRRMTLRANVNMSAPIMSRFDLFFVVLDECDEAVDRHLARHIVDVHALRDAAVTPEFSTEQLQRYIRFARTFKPVFTPEAKTLLVEKYKELRADDSGVWGGTGGAGGVAGRNNYRITVRQLESLIRLSEAIAKANCVDDVTPDFVREAFSLLRSSIIVVEREDVDVDDDDEAADLANVAAAAAGDIDEEDDDDDEAADAAATNAPDTSGDSPMHNSDPTTGAAGAAQQQRSRTRITNESYTAHLTTLLRLTAAHESATGQGIPHSTLLVTYLEEREAAGDLPDVDAYEAERGLLEKVVRKMVRDGVLMGVRGEGLRDADADGPDGDGHAEVVYVVHPNVAVDEM